MSHTVLVARMSSCARATARTSAWVTRHRLGLVWANASSGLPKRRCLLALLARSGRFGLAHQDQHVEGIELHRRQVGELGLRDPLVGGTQVLADIGTEVVDSPLQQLASHARGRQLVAGEQPDLLCRANPIENGLDGTARQVGQVGVFPALLDPCECQLHAADVRQDLEAVLAQSIAEIGATP